MKYLCLICADTWMERMPAAVAEQHYRDYDAFTRDIKHRGHFVSGNRLLPHDTARTLRVRNGAVVVTDGPFVEAREQLGGYYVIDAASMDEALAIAARIPGAQIGCVEVRPIADDPQTLALGLDSPIPPQP
jgi:hypothetical protein